MKQRKVWVVMQWGSDIHSIHTNEKKARAVAEDLLQISWRVQVLGKQLNKVP